MNNRIGYRETASLITFIVISTMTGIGMYDIVNITGRDGYLCVIISGVMGIIPLLLLFLYYKKYDMDIRECNIINMGNIMGSIVNGIIKIFIFIMGMVTIASIGNFIGSQYLNDTPIMVISLCMGMLVFYVNYKGLEVLTRTSMMLLFFTLILYLMAIMGLSPDINLDNIKPFMDNGINLIFKGGYVLFFTNIVPIMLLLFIPGKRINNTKKYKKWIIIFYILGVMLVFMTVFITISVLGINLVKFYQYPEYIVLRKISFMGLIDRIENVISIQWIFRCFIMISLCVYGICNNNKRNNNLMIFIISLGLSIISIIIFKNIIFFDYFILNIYPYINMGFFILICICIMINMICKKQ